MSKFHRLPIARVERETRDAVAVTFAVPEALRDQFCFTQGQHLTLRAQIGGEDVRRSYSICSAVQDGALRIAVKRSPGGAFSTWANEALKVGATCHDVRRKELGTPDLTQQPEAFSPITLTAAAWRHGSAMRSAMQQQGIAWPQFHGAEMTDLIAYLNSRLVVRIGGER